MNDAQRAEVKKMIEDAFSEILGVDRFTFQSDVQIFDARNIQLGRGTGTKIATATDQKLAFWGATPVDRPDTVADPSGGGSSATDAIDIAARQKIVQIIDRLQEIGLIST